MRDFFDDFNTADVGFADLDALDFDFDDTGLDEREREDFGGGSGGVRLLLLRRIDRSLLGDRLVLLANFRRLELFFRLDRGGGLAGVRERWDFVVGGGRGGVRFLKRLFFRGVF